MAAFSTAELALLERIRESDPLRTNLAVLREAVEKIWDTESPRVIQDFTDHGIRHYERLAGYAAKLLEANQGRDLSAQEAYLLLAGIYIHDIGMQCDVVRFPEIKERAISLGATFDVEKFSAERANDYSLQEQKDIRKNHHWLSIAWIDVARKTSENVLHMAASGIPSDLVSDLKDVAVHHTKLAIGGCPVTFTLDPSGRKQFVAALLRFADELDIESNRVNIETVRTFSISPLNSVYWWLHHQTRITWPTQSLLNISVVLHPDDHDEFAKTVHDVYLNEFRTKNLPVLSVLAQNQVPIVMDSESKVVSFDEADGLPGEIKSALRKMVSPREHDLESGPLWDLVNEVRLWLRAIRYEVGEDPSMDGEVGEMTATLDSGTIRQCVLVRCIARSITVEDVHHLEGSLTQNVNQGWLISDRSISDDVRRSLQQSGVLAFRLSEFLEQRVWGPYIDSIRSLVENDRIPELYVDIGCYRQPFGDSGDQISGDSSQSLDATIDEWLSAREKVHVSLLGEFGSGKTWFCRHYAYRQLRRYLANPANERFPLLITLRNFTKATTAKELITYAIVDQYQLSFVGDPFDVFEELNRRGKILLILDGFDEMARRVDKQTMVDNFWELARLVHDNSKVILTSRTEYFRWAKEAESVLGGEEFGRKFAALQPPRFEVLYLESFTDDQIRSVVTGRLGASDAQAADRLLSNENLREMARKPVLVELLLASAKEADAGLVSDHASVYLYAINKLLVRNITSRRTFTSTSDKLLFLCELAWQMIESGELRVHYKEIPDRIRRHFSDKISGGSDLDHWDFDLRNQTLLRPDLQGFYEFSHRSIAEFFVALKFCAELGCLSPSFSNAFEESGEAPCAVPFSKLEDSSLAETFGAKNIAGEDLLPVRKFMLHMMGDADRILARLSGVRGEKGLAHLVGNIGTLLSEMGVLVRAQELTNMNFRGALLRSSQLRGKKVDGSIFAEATIVLDDAVELESGFMGYGVVQGSPALLSRQRRAKNEYVDDRQSVTVCNLQKWASNIYGLRGAKERNHTFSDGFIWWPFPAEQDDSVCGIYNNLMQILTDEYFLERPVLIKRMETELMVNEFSLFEMYDDCGLSRRVE